MYLRTFADRDEAQSRKNYLLVNVSRNAFQLFYDVYSDLIHVSDFHNSYVKGCRVRTPGYSAAT
jgi:hypothetical protein